MNMILNTGLLATVVIVSYNTRELLRQCLISVQQAQRGLPIHVIVVDNASKDGSADMVEQAFSDVKLIRSEVNLGFAAANNLAFSQSHSQYVVLLNPDARLPADSLSRAISWMDQHIRVAMAGGRLIGRTGQDEPSARMFPSLLNEFLVLSGLAARYPQSRLYGRFDRTWADPQQAAAVDWVPGAFAIVRTSVLQDVNGFDEQFFLYYEEVDLCRRIKQAGWEIWYLPELVIHHLGGESAKTVTQHVFAKAGSQLLLWQLRSMLLYFYKHHGGLYTKLVMLLHHTWQKLRLCKPQPSDKKQQLKNILSLQKQAWHDTEGGRVSPIKPW